ncbi:MAG: CopD family protein [Thaumarchaeota archaeon]|nr:CopD family protein [Nitrososphaerota archaeon]
MKKLFLLSVILLAISIPHATAHPFVLESSPDSLSNASVGITEVYVIYTESVDLDFSSIKVFDSNGNQIDNKDTRYHESDSSLVVSTPPLEDGIYTVAHKVLSNVDGHLVPYAFVFAVGDVILEPELVASQDISDTIFFPEAGSRFPGLVGQTIILGAVMASLLIWGTQNKQLIRNDLEKLNHTYHGKFMSVTGVGLVLVVASNIIMLAVQIMRLESSVLDVIQTTFGTTWLIRMSVTVALLVVWFWLERKKYLTKANQIPMLVLSLVLIGTTTMIGHGAASEQPAAIILDYMHNLVAAIWIGGIIFFAFALLPTFSKLDSDKKERMSLVVIPRFSIAFVVAVGLVIITGPTLMWFLESDVTLIVESTYGKLIMAKIAIAAVMVGIGGFSQLLQKSVERSVGTRSFFIHRRLRRSLKVDVALGVLLLGAVALLANGTLPAGEIQRADAQDIVYGFSTTAFSENAKFDVIIEPFASGNNSIHVKVSDSDGNPLSDLDELKVKVSNPQRNISPIQVQIQKLEDGGPDEFAGQLQFGFSGVWQVEVDANRTENANESILLDLLIKPRLTDMRFDVVEYELPVPSKPLYPLFDGKDSIWISDPSAPRLWKYSINSGEFESFSYDGVTSVWLTIDHEGKVWFTDPPGNQIGFIEPVTNEITRISLPQLAPAISKNTATAIQAGQDGDIWIAVINKDVILRYDQVQGTFEEIRLPDKESLPFALGIDNNGMIWFTESGKGRIGYIDPENNELREFEPDVPLQSPEALLFGNDGSVWVSEHTGSGIARFDPILETFERILIPDEDALPYGMSFDVYGNIWIALHTIDSMAVYDPDNDSVIQVDIPTAESFAQFTTNDNEGNVWFVEQQGNKLATIKKTILFPAPPPATNSSDIRYAEIASPLIAMGIVATSLFFVKNVHDKRRLNRLVLN